jgi:catalase
MEVGELTLDRHPENYFQEAAPSGFEPGNNRARQGWAGPGGRGPLT